MKTFSICSSSGNLYIMLARHYDCNVILVKPSCSKHDRHRLAAYNNIRRRIKQLFREVNIKELDNKSRK